MVIIFLSWYILVSVPIFFQTVAFTLLIYVTKIGVSGTCLGEQSTVPAFDAKNSQFKKQRVASNGN